jgi:RNA polymerase sigma-70 factor (ECF subfamily)
VERREPTDDELVERCKAGEKEAYTLLSNRHRAGLVRFNTYIIGDHDEAENLAQESLARAYEQINQFRTGQSFGAWLRGFGLNLCRNFLRSRRRHAKPTAPEVLNPAPDPEGQKHGVLSGIMRGELHDRLWLAVSQLPLDYREALVLHYIDGLDYNEISGITGATAGALRVRALRARHLLKASLGSVVDTWLLQSDDEPASQTSR